MNERTSSKTGLDAPKSRSSVVSPVPRPLPRSLFARPPSHLSTRGTTGVKAEEGEKKRETERKTEEGRATGREEQGQQGSGAEELTRIQKASCMATLGPPLPIQVLLPVRKPGIAHPCPLVLS